MPSTSYVVLLYLVMLAVVSVNGLSTTTMTRRTSMRTTTRTQLYYHYYAGGNNGKGDSYNTNKSNWDNSNNNDRRVIVPSARPISSPPGSLQSSQLSSADEFLQWEAEIQESAIRGMDLQRIQEWLDSDDSNDTIGRRGSDGTTTQRENGWKVATASGVVMALGCNYVTHSVVLSLLTLVVVTWVALKDPLDDGDGLVGPMARILGRTTLDSYQKIKPKLKSLARAAIQNEDRIAKLSTQVKELSQENQALRLYQQRREWIDANQSHYSLEELKSMAQQVQQQSYPTRTFAYSTLSKQQLMMRLLEVGALRINRIP